MTSRLLDSPWLQRPRRAAGAVKRWLFPSPALAAWNHAVRESQRVSRFTAGEIELDGLRIRYTDLLTICPQWHDLFVRDSLRFACSKPNPRILDCGANIGLASLYYKRANPDARVTAYEADPDVYAALAENLRRNTSTGAEAVCAAVWTTDEGVTFRCEGADSGTIGQFAGSLGGTTKTVPSVRLRDLLAKERVDLLKLDIEGAELDVLRDCGGALDNVDALLLDLHEFQPGGRSTPAVLDLLHDRGFVYAIDELNVLPWRPPVADESTPFPKTAMCWAMLVRAWRNRNHHSGNGK